MFSHPSNNKLTLPIRAVDHVRGSENALLTIVEYGNFQCPICGQAYWIIKEIQQYLGDDFCFVFRHFPQTDIYGQAQKAAEAIEAAAAQGKFWQMHEMLFEHQQGLDDSYLVEYAVELNLNLPQFLKDMSEHTFSRRVHDDLMSGIRSGVNKTPTFFLDGIRQDGGVGLIKLIASVVKSRNFN